MQASCQQRKGRKGFHRPLNTSGRRGRASAQGRLMEEGLARHRTGAPRQVWETGHHPQGCYQWCQVPQSLQTTRTPSFTSLNDRTVMVCPSPVISPLPPALGGGNIRTQDFSDTETQQGHPTCTEPHSQPQHHMGLRHCLCEVKDRVKKAWVLTE